VEVWPKAGWPNADWPNAGWPKVDFPNAEVVVVFPKADGIALVVVLPNADDVEGNADVVLVASEMRAGSLLFLTACW